MIDPITILDKLGLAPLPVEGGYFAQTFKADETIPVAGLPERYRSDRVLSSAIYYLLSSEADSFSALHRLVSEEIWHFYLGDPVDMLLLYENGDAGNIVLGQDILNGEQVQFTVPRLTWQGACLRPGGRFALMGTTMAPGYHDEDVAFADREKLIRSYPGQADQIRRLTRPAAS